MCCGLGWFVDPKFWLCGGLGWVKEIWPRTTLRWTTHLLHFITKKINPAHARTMLIRVLKQSFWCCRYCLFRQIVNTFFESSYLSGRMLGTRWPKEFTTKLSSPKLFILNEPHFHDKALYNNCYLVTFIAIRFTYELHFFNDDIDLRRTKTSSSQKFAWSVISNCRMTYLYAGKHESQRW